MVVDWRCPIDPHLAAQSALASAESLRSARFSEIYSRARCPGRENGRIPPSRTDQNDSAVISSSDGGFLLVSDFALGPKIQDARLYVSRSFVAVRHS